MTTSASPTHPPAHAHSHSPWLIANLLAQLAFGLLAMTLCLPSMQEWGALFATDQAHVQLTFSGYVVAYGGLQLIYGPLSDRHGRKAILLVGLLIACVASALAVFSTDIRWLTAARILQGAGSAASMVVGRTLARGLAAGDAVRKNDLKARQWFNAGDMVRIVAGGPGYAISSEGQAMGPGLEGQAVRVRTEAGRIITGVATGDRQIEVAL